MVARRMAPVCSLVRALLIVATVMPGVACVGTDAGQSLLAWKRETDEKIELPAAEQMIDELDRIMTAYGTISVKIPDVWGQDRLARFRCEYESQMAAWLKVGFKGDINASVRHAEAEATRVQVGADLVQPQIKGTNTTSQTSVVSLDTTMKAQTGMNAALPVFSSPADKAPASLESTVVLDEHSNYLNHLNQLRRVNLGDDLADRPGYGLYLIRIPVTLSPGPKSRRGKGAIITVSAKPVMTKTTLRSALRNALVNETVNNVTQAICDEWTRDGERTRGPGTAPYSLVAYADTELFYGHENVQLLRDEAVYQLANDLGDEPHHRVARVSEWIRGELEASYHLLEQAVTPVRSAQQLASVVDPLEEFGDTIAMRDLRGSRRWRKDAATTPWSKRPEDN